jgi:hypothetical protein
VTPFEICSASFATMSPNEVWPWAVPLLATQGFALVLAALGFSLISQARHDVARSIVLTHEGRAP